MDIPKDKMVCCRCKMAWTDDEKLGPWMCSSCKGIVQKEYEDSKN